MSSLVRRIQKNRNGWGKMLGVSNSKATDLVARLKRSIKSEIKSEIGVVK